ncbi:hypothetical protein P2G88_11085 [Aliiglaciecola sp. CAU 1673]|uniref:hypothetical protein n=1 Tax=Aliiglaciecola sp. CAU 1673 TaxID=3032595 RepID=UPI0023DA4A3B|nr:hypothetical protein [Aliiglaciecola sp. CAU 1673]MDF2178791.1 hypothetical protein [Aliiglaciecola sp. CAU 1673]
MQVQIAYSFALEQEAYRFLNALKHWPVADVDARFHKAANSVKVTYQYQDTGFDRTSSELDDLASQYGGHEVAL